MEIRNGRFASERQGEGANIPRTVPRNGGSGSAGPSWTSGSSFKQGFAMPPIIGPDTRRDGQI
jgi:hypothetical protein